jgi:uncharacterized protein (TIGR00255 family)
MNSMTGYAFREFASPEISFSVEIKSYNSRSLDLTINLPPFLGRLESHFRGKVEQNIRRGKVEAHVRIKYLKQAPKISVNHEAALAWKAALSCLAREIGRGGTLPLEFIARQEGVLVAENEADMDFFQNAIDPVFSDALQGMISEREQEGAHLLSDLSAQLDTLEKARQFFVDWQPKMDELFRSAVTKRFSELTEAPPLEGDAFNEQRILAETAALLVKYTINEEVIRLGAHLESLRHSLSEDAPGRKIDFICQELNREINTIGSKNQFIEVGEMVIVAKNALENLREQARNVE